MASRNEGAKTERGAEAKFVGAGKRPGSSGGGGTTARQGHAEPSAAIAGAWSRRQPRAGYYRWTGGKSLQELVPIPPEKPM